MTDGVIIFPFCTLKSVKDIFWMEYDQRMIIRFFWNNGIDVHEIAHKLQAQFDEHAYVLQTVGLSVVEVWLGRQDFHDEILIGRPPLDDLDVKILTIFDKYPFELACSRSETLGIAC
jgi:hypothetical protein